MNSDNCSDFAEIFFNLCVYVIWGEFSEKFIKQFFAWFLILQESSGVNGIESHKRFQEKDKKKKKLFLLKDKKGWKNEFKLKLQRRYKIQ